MSYHVPDFETDDDYSIPPPSSSSSTLKKSIMAEDDIVELLWQNGQVVMQRSSGSSAKKQSQPSKQVDEAGKSTAMEQPQKSGEDQHQLFMQEDEMASWLHYPLHDADDFCSDLLYSASPPPPPPPRFSEASAATAASRQLIPPPIPAAEQRLQNFGHFSRRPLVSKAAVVRESTVIESSSAATADANRRTETAAGSANAAARDKDVAAAPPCEASITSSTGVSAASAEPAYKATPQSPPPPLPPLEDRKRKGRESEEIECQSEDVKQARGSTSTKRSRAAEVHNLSERRRRDRINEKMRALQELIPRCNKSDKASMLDEAIEYLKSLQLQVQMMSMGCGMVPMMFPGVQQYMPPVAMGLGMEMGVNRPIMPFPNILAGSPLPPPTHLGPPRFPVPVFPMPTVHASDPPRTQASNRPDLMVSFRMQNSNQPQVPSFMDPYQQFLGLHQMQAPMVQTQAMGEASSSKPSTSKEPENPQ